LGQNLIENQSPQTWGWSSIATKKFSEAEKGEERGAGGSPNKSAGEGSKRKRLRRRTKPHSGKSKDKRNKSFLLPETRFTKAPRNEWVPTKESLGAQ